MAKIPLHPKNPERVCWGCDQYCSADHLRCGNGTERTQHPAELFGDDWYEWANGDIPDVPGSLIPVESLGQAEPLGPSSPQKD